MNTTRQLSGRELDALVAEKVMGWKPILDGMQHGKRQPVFRDPQGTDHTLDCGCVEDFNPSTDISAAMEVVEKMEALNYQWAFHRNAPHKSIHDNKPHAEFWSYREGVLEGVHSATADTLSRAICLAALAAITKEEK